MSLRLENVWREFSIVSAAPERCQRKNSHARVRAIPKMPASSLESALLGVVRARADSAAAWMAGVRPTDMDAFCGAYTAAARKAGRELLALTEAERIALGSSAPEARFDRWTVADAARAALLLRAADALDAADFQALAIGCFERGDAGEQASWMRAVALLPSPERFLPIVIDSCRTN